MGKSPVQLLQNSAGCPYPPSAIGRRFTKNPNYRKRTFLQECVGFGALDGPLPYGDAAGLTGATLLTLGAAIWGAYQASQSSATPKIQEQEKDITIRSKPKSQAYFTVDPHEFNPRGLVMTEYPGTRNGRIIVWKDPINNNTIFEWDEDLKYGSHYHTMMVEWDGIHNGTHYLPGTPVPEPWNSIYFGG